MRIGGNRSSRNVEDRRGEKSSGGRGGMAAGSLALPLLLFRVLFSKLGRRLILPVLVIGGALYFFVPGGRGIVTGLLAMVLGGSPGAMAPAGPALPPAQEAAFFEFSEDVFATTEEVWGAIFREAGENYPEPNLVIYSGFTQTGCGGGQAAMGPFYCPVRDPRSGKPSVYIDLSFFEQMATRMNAGGDFAQAYVIAHEVGHHIQNITGVLEDSQRSKQSARSERESNQIQVRVELQADCYAGVWANRAQGLPGVALEPGDLEEAVRAAEAVGDDTLQRRAHGRVVPDAFTHGTSAQRIRWFQTGYRSGDPASCDTFAPAYERL